jgi:phospholipid/cholesterol/gamma-HCH transport system substrate-binding protein
VRSRRRRLAVVLAGVVVTALAAVALLGRESGYLLRLELDDAAGLRSDFAVKVGGVPVGTVEQVELGPDDRAVAELRLEDSVAPVGWDATAAIRPSNLVGEKYVDLEPGDTSRPAPSGMLIPRSRTATPTELDDLLAVLDGDTRVALGIFLEEQGRALGGRGSDLASALVRLPPALDETRELVAGLARDNRALGRLIAESDRVLSPVSRERRSLGRLVEAAGGALDALASRRTELGETIRRAPGTVVQLRRSLIELERAAGPLGPAAMGLSATAAPLEQSLRELPAFVDAARPALRSARRAAPLLTRLGRQASPVVARLRPMTASLDAYVGRLDPVTDLFDRGIADLLGVLQGWARTTRNKDAAGHVLRADLVMGGDLRGKLLDYIGGAGRARSRRVEPRRRARTPAPENAPQEVGRREGSPLDELLRRELPRVADPVRKQPQVQGVQDALDALTPPLLDYLLGP